MPTIKLTDAQPLLAEYRIFLLGPNMRSVDDTGSGYPAVINYTSDLSIEPYTTFFAGGGRTLFTMGAFSYCFGAGLPHLLRVGRYCSIARGLTVMGEDHPADWVTTSPAFYTHELMMRTYMSDHDVSLLKKPYQSSIAPAEIGNDVWIGQNVTLARGVKIGDGAILASNAVVTKDVAPYSIVGGVPAKHIKYRFDGDTVETLAQSKWWEYGPEVLSTLPISRPREFALEVEKGALEGAPKFTPQPLTAEILEAASRR